MEITSLTSLYPTGRWLHSTQQHRLLRTAGGRFGAQGHHLTSLSLSFELIITPFERL